MAAADFDVAACRQITDMYPDPPDDRRTLLRMWRVLVADIEAACDEIERLQTEASE